MRHLGFGFCLLGARGDRRAGRAHCVFTLQLSHSTRPQAAAAAVWGGAEGLKIQDCTPSAVPLKVGFSEGRQWTLAWAESSTRS